MASGVKKTVTADSGGVKQGSIETVFTHNTFSDNDRTQMLLPTLSRETKSTGEDVIGQFPMPI